MTNSLVWKSWDAKTFEARKLTAAGGQYLIVRQTTGFDVWNRCRSYIGEIHARFLGHAATIDEAKTIAQADAAIRRRPCPPGPSPGGPGCAKQSGPVGWMPSPFGRMASSGAGDYGRRSNADRGNTMTRNIAFNEKWVFEVRAGVLLIFGERTDLADGWWFSTNDESFGPFATDQAALDAAAAASNETVELNVVASPNPALPVTDPGERFPLWRDETN